MAVILCSLMPLGPSHKPKSWVGGGGGLNIQTVDKMEKNRRRIFCPANDAES
jgi:hypothetical protein